jgi:hypothetical protein
VERENHDAKGFSAMDMQQRYTGRQSPVDVVTRIQQELAEFQRIYSNNKRVVREALREALRETLLSACQEAVFQAVNRPDVDPIVAHFKRGLIGSDPHVCGVASDPEPAALVIPIKQA